jgi:hypothetical protein
MHFTDIEYFGHSVDILKSLAELISQMETFSLRDTIVEYFDYLSDKDKRKLRCNQCVYNPRKVFLQLREYFVKNISQFWHVFQHIVNVIGGTRQSYEECVDCTLTTLEDLSFILELYKKIEREVLQVVSEERIALRL